MLMKIENPRKLKRPKMAVFYVAKINGLETWVPEDPKNKDYAELKKQEREGRIVVNERTRVEDL